jgi:demethylmenaquinone methyltransferase / 2-methoxy-6-polyprenyl-1,4-benzoquinol methylase
MESATKRLPWVARRFAVTNALVPERIDAMANVECKTPVRPVRDLPEFVPAERKRAEFVQDIFDHTARHYDALSAALSFGTCRAYRRFALRRAGLRPGMKLLDVASGTGLVARAALQLGLRDGDIIGLDPSSGMLHQNRQRHSISLVQAFGETLPFADQSFDFITMGYALRHVEDLVALFTEFGRVLRKGGRILVLEITRPASGAATALARFYMCKVLPPLARLCTGNRDTAKLLRFYWTTIQECVPPAVILGALESAGLQDVKRHTTGSLLSDYMACRH